MREFFSADVDAQKDFVRFDVLAEHEGRQQFGFDYECSLGDMPVHYSRFRSLAEAAVMAELSKRGIPESALVDQVQPRFRPGFRDG